MPFTWDLSGKCGNKESNFKRNARGEALKNVGMIPGLADEPEIKLPTSVGP